MMKEKKFSEILRFFTSADILFHVPGTVPTRWCFRFGKQTGKILVFLLKLDFSLLGKKGQAKGEWERNVRRKIANYGRHNVDERKKSAKLLPVRLDSFRPVKVLGKAINRESPQTFPFILWRSFARHECTRKGIRESLQGWRRKNQVRKIKMGLGLHFAQSSIFLRIWVELQVKIASSLWFFLPLTIQWNLT